MREDVVGNKTSWKAATVLIDYQSTMPGGHSVLSRTLKEGPSCSEVMTGLFNIRRLIYLRENPVAESKGLTARGEYLTNTGASVDKNISGRQSNSTRGYQ